MSLLEINRLAKEFGGVVAVDEVSFSVERGTIHSVIGPNGAGKTTLFNLITGVYQPTSGAVGFDGKDLSGVSVDGRAQLGLTRTFQNLQVCMNMTAVENVMLGAHRHLNSRLTPNLLRFPTIAKQDRQIRAKARDLMTDVGLSRFADMDAHAMPYGALKRLEIARALALEPELLLLDEPAAGLNGTETAELGDLILKLSETGLTIVIVEHDMGLVMRVSHQIVVLNYGRKLAEGTPGEIRQNPEVINAYLGTVT